MSTFHEVLIVHQFSKSFSIFTIQMTYCLLSLKMRLFEDDLTIDLIEFVIKLFHALKINFDYFDDFTSFSTKEF